VLVICNHITDVDLGFVLAALPSSLGNRLAIATAGEELEALRTPPPGRSFWGRVYDPVKWSMAVSLLNLFPLPRQAGFLESFAYAGDSVDRGYSILVFPEGKHTVDGKLQPFRSGIGLLANNLGIPVVPMRIHGLFEVKQAGKKFAAPGRIRVEIGSPVKFSRGEDPAKIAQVLQRIVEGL
jgi:long-chain acyl-CoA synthetase